MQYTTQPVNRGIEDVIHHIESITINIKNSRHMPIYQYHEIGWLVKRWLYNACASIGLVKPTKRYIVKNGKLDID